ncbi:hypothetical protein D9619_011153 [Psilocybe cf. subviscida]|uniref:ACB domain-containing protein n=1 Tax=Psilocybe cf. subviscida TaxID=2480587 RepID=A0A8H5F558_9AGAR|nr:hypothetical protein D9619_011153 [Psilocybe cf. subviscida]
MPPTSHAPTSSHTTTSHEKFHNAVATVHALPKDGPVKPMPEEQLHFYKYSKQATIGDNTAARPGSHDVVGKAKGDAWTSVSSTSKEGAHQKYVAKIFEILKKDNDEQSKKSVAEIEK